MTVVILQYEEPKKLFYPPMDNVFKLSWIIEHKEHSLRPPLFVRIINYMTTVQQHELSNYSPLTTVDDSNGVLLLNPTNPTLISSSILMQPSRWKTKGKSINSKI